MTTTYQAASKEDQEKYDGINVTAPEHLVWVCAACGKTSRTRSGRDEKDQWVADQEGDEEQK